MFYCEKDRKKNGWPKGFSISRGKCEVCGHIRDCYDVPSKNLPMPPQKHVLITHINCREEHNCPICDGGLGICKYCGGAEGSLPTECPVTRMSQQQDHSVFTGILDFKKGEWVGRVTKLEYGKIPAFTKCPYTEWCDTFKDGSCNHQGVKHDIVFSCGMARALDMAK